MVRLDKCVEALYDSVRADTRSKSLQVLTVMKGAISMSRSKTGECIFRTNKMERRNLDRLLKIEGRHASYSVSQIESHRKNVINRWSKFVANQTTASCSSQALFEELMEIEEVLENDDELHVHRNSPVHGDSPVHGESPEPRELRLKTLIDLRLAKLEGENNTSGFETIMASRRRHKPNSFKADENADDTGNKNLEKEFVTEVKEIRNKYPQEDASKPETVLTNVHGVRVSGTGLPKYKVVNLPSVRGQAVPTVSKSEEVMPPVFERDPTDWTNWTLTDKSRINGYLRREKTRHEDLIIRNALNKIETDMSGQYTIRRQQMRQKLQNERQQKEAEIRRKERAQQEAEITRQIRALSSASAKSAPESMKTLGKTPQIVKHVAFKETSISGENNMKQCVRKRRYKSLSSSLEHLPVIRETITSAG